MEFPCGDAVIVPNSADEIARENFLKPAASILLCAMLSICGLATWAADAEQHEAQRPSDYISVLGSRSFPERDLGTSHRGGALSLLYGHPLNNRLAIEPTFSAAIFETGLTGGTDYYTRALTLDLRLNLLAADRHAITPYLLLGAGAQRDDYYPNSRDGSGFVAEGAVGIVTGLIADRFALRLEGRYVHESREGGHGEPRISLGVQIPLGRIRTVTVTRVEYVPQEKIVEREVVREVVREVPAVRKDSDGDSVADDLDKCPDTPRGLRVDASGCVVVNQAIELRGVTFELNKARLTPNAQTVLDEVSKAFVGQPSLRVEIAGHTDSTGSDEANLRLSQARADSVRSYLIFKGAREAQLTSKGYGEAALLISPERTAEDRERNRRVELRVLDGR